MKVEMVLLNSKRIKSIVINGTKYVNLNYSDEKNKDANDTDQDQVQI